MSRTVRPLAWIAVFGLAAALLVIPTLASTPAAALTTYVVDTVDDTSSLNDCTGAAHDCSLRGAIGLANANPGADVVEFNIPSSDCPSGVCRITLVSGGFYLNEAVSIDATTQPQYGGPSANVCATMTAPSHPRVEIVVDAGIDNSVFYINNDTGATEIRGFALGTSIPSGGSGVTVLDGSGHHIACNHFNLNAAGTAVPGVGDFVSGVTIYPAASGVTIGVKGDGVDDFAERNVFGPDTTNTVNVIGSIDNVIAGNYFGFSADGTVRLGSGSLWLRDNCQGTTIGTDRDGVADGRERNFFTGTSNIRVAAAAFDNDEVKISGNTFGMSPAGEPAVSLTGIRVEGLAASTTGFEISRNTFTWVETGMVLDANAGDVVVSGNQFGGEHDGSPFGGFIAIRAGRNASYVISDNLILNSQSTGILVEDNATLDAASRDNCLVGNGTGMTNTTGDGISFENNWWGDQSGPSGLGPGSGDPVGALVDYEPWLTAPARLCNTAPAIAAANFTVAEDAAVGTELGTITATDDGDDVEFSIVDGNDGAAFAIDAETGLLTVASALDYETTPAYVLAIAASDPFLRSFASVAVVVTDVDEPDPEPTFIDVPLSHTFYADIEWLAGEGITRGCNPPTNDMFCPDGEVTRGQMAAFLHRALGDVLVPGAPVEFTDDDQSVFEDDIEWLGAVGVTRGCNPPTNDMFCPDAAVTREQMAAFLVRALDLPPATGIDFADDNDSIFEADIEALAGAGITRGCNPPVNDMFCPDAAVTRGQMAAFLYRALG